MKNNQKKADNDNHANQLNKNNPEYGNARNKQNEQAPKKPKVTPEIKEPDKPKNRFGLNTVTVN